MVTLECIIPQEHHRTVLGIRGFKEKNIRRQFNVTIKFSDRETPKDADKVTMNRDAHADGLEAKFQASFEAQIDELKKHAIFKTKTGRRIT
ncbi:vigilin [Nephila pilipes]|uniref:Vigilin n=1 Tax=Nephila pilipes TaxID=299642 RepID=A0A8X6Q157_NEPPI|nr:vigilin [Nephila pilipes]